MLQIPRIVNVIPISMPTLELLASCGDFVVCVIAEDIGDDTRAEVLVLFGAKVGLGTAEFIAKTIFSLYFWGFYDER